MTEKYKHHSIRLDDDGTFSVYHPVYGHLCNRESVEACKGYIDWKETEANRRVAWSMAHTLMGVR